MVRPLSPPAQLLTGDPEAFPVILDPACWAAQFAGATTKNKLYIAREWLTHFNRYWEHVRGDGDDAAALLHTLVAQYYRWIAVLHPYVEKHWFSPEQFQGSLASLVQLTKNHPYESVPDGYHQIVHQLWFDPPENAHELLAAIFDMAQAGAFDAHGTHPEDSPYWGMLVPNLAWDVVDRLPLTFPKRYVYEGVAAWLTGSAAISMRAPLHTHLNKRALAWQALMWHTFNEEPMDIYNYHGCDIHTLVRSLPTMTKLLALPATINVMLVEPVNGDRADYTAPLAQAVQGPVDLYTTFRAWTTDIDPMLTIAQATELTVWELVEYLLDAHARTSEEQHGVALPNDLIDG